MRIIAGEFRGRRIQAPPGRATRPMLDRVREAVFSSVAPWLPEARVLDLFAGSGSLGFEALSRGAAYVRAIESSAKAAELIRSNADELGIGTERFDVVLGDALSPTNWIEEGADLVFLDPPFPMVNDLDGRGRLFEAIEQLAATGLRDEGLIVLHVPVRRIAATDFPDSFECRVREYGRQAIWYVQA